MSLRITLPTTGTKTVYNPQDPISFNVKIQDGFEIIPGSLRIAGRLALTKTAAGGPQLGADDDCYYECAAGIHNFFKSIVSICDKGVIENNNSEYSRYVAMLRHATSETNERSTNSKYWAELSLGSDDQTLQAMRGDGQNEQGFCFSPMIALNRTNRGFSDKDTGMITINLTLQSPTMATYFRTLGGAALAGLSYTITAPKLLYKVQPIQSTGKLMMRIVSASRKSINSQIASIEYILAQPCVNFVGNFATTANVNGVLGLNQNSMAIAKPTLRTVKYMFQDSNGTMLSYELDNDPEILMNYRQALQQSADASDLSLANLSQLYGTGINFLTPRPAGSKLTVEIAKDPADGNAYEFFSYMEGFLEL